MADTVIFDLDGTLLNTLDDLCDSVNFALSKFDYPNRTKDEVKKFVGDGVKLLFIRALPSEINQNILNNCINTFKNHYSENMYNKTAPYEDIINILKELKENSYKIGIVSNKFDGAVKELSEKYFKNLIDISIGQADDVPQKPAPNGVFKVLKELNSKEAVFVGDSDVDIQTAKNSNLKSIGVTWGFRDRENLNGANIIIDKPKQLIQAIRSL